jgi:hypothetical protein
MGTQIANNIDKGGYAAGLFAPELARATVSGVTDALGLESGEQKRVNELKQVMSTIDPKDANSLMAAASKFMGMGMMTEANQLMQEARKVQDSASSANLRMAQANKANSYYDLEMFKTQSKNMTEDKKLQVKQSLETQKMALDRQIALAKDETERAKLESVRDLTQAKIDELGTRSALNEARTTNAINGVDTNLTETEMFNKWVDEGKQNGVVDPFKYALDKRSQYTTAKNPNAGKLDPEVNKELLKTEAERREYSATGTTASSLADKIEALGKSGKYPNGWAGKAEEVLKSALGSGDAATYAKVQAQDIIIKNMLANLPTGTASDADMRLVATAQVESLDNPALIAQYLRGVAKLSKKMSEYSLEKSKYLSKNSVAGLSEHMSSWAESKWGNGETSQSQADSPDTKGRKFIVVAPQGVPDGDNTYKGQPVVVIGGKVYAK